MYSKEQIRAIVRDSDILSIIGGYVQLKKSGRGYLGLCPFHQEKTPSFSVDPIKKFYHCFGCGKHGDTLQFLMEYSNASFLEALDQLAVKQGIRLKVDKKNFHPTRKILDVAQGFFLEKAQNLPVEVQEYLQSRKLKPESIKNFEIGYAPNTWDAFKNYLSKDSFLEAKQAGLLKKSEKAGNYYDFFRHRIMFPFRDIQGSLVGFAGRSISEDNLPKYLNSPEFELFQKNSFFYGLFQAKDAINQKKRIIVVEGYLDVICMSEYGLQEVVAVAGTAITKKHIYALKQKAIEVTFLFDGDEAGNKAQMKAAIMGLSYGLDAKVAILPEKSDPDSFLQEHSIEQMQNLLANAKDVFSYILEEKQKLYKQTESLVEKDKILGELAEIGNSIEEVRKKNIFFVETAKIFGIDGKIFARNLSNVKEKHKLDKPEIETIEIKLMKAVVQDLNYLSLIKKYLEPKDFQDKVIQRLLERLFSIEQEAQAISWLELLQVFRDDKEIAFFLLSCAKKEIFKQPQGMLEQWVYEIKKKSIYRNYGVNYDNNYSFAEQKEVWQICKMKLKEIEGLATNPVYQRNSYFRL